MAFAPLFFVALLAAAAVAAASRTTSTTTPTPGTSTRERIPPDLSLCRQSAADVSILDSSALVRWVSCEGRTSQDVAILVQRLEQAAHDYPGAGYDRTAQSVRTTWNAQIDAAEAARDAAARAPEQSEAPSRGRQTGRAPAELCATPAAELSIVNESRVLAWARCPGRTPGEIEAVAARGAAAGKPSAWVERVRAAAGSTSPRSAPTRSAPSSRVSEADRRLEEELARAERAYPPARSEYAEAMARATPSELRRAADTIEDTDPTFREIPARLRRRAAERERAST